MTTHASAMHASKTIRRHADLALAGAPPAYLEALHVGRPNIGDTQHFQRQIDAMFQRRWLSNNGPIVQEFEQRVAQYLGVKHCVAICNGTIALEIAIRALGLTGEVILPSYTFIASAHSLAWLGITPVFADIDPITHNLDPESVRKLITPRTSGIMGVHLWGRAAPVAELEAIAKEHKLALFFDAAHAFGCSHLGQKIGGFGRAEILSFHATKFFNTFEGGAVVSNDDALVEKMRLMRNFGFQGFDNVVHPGTNGKMVEVCAAMGLTNLDFIAQVIAANENNIDAYAREFAGIPGLTLLPYDRSEANNFQYVIAEIHPECPVTRDQIVAALTAENILARKYFWPGCHLMQPYKTQFPDADARLPNTNLVANRVIVLPTGTTLPSDAPATIASVIRALIGG
jgi:dTDP-4-amino-4,6-dideoxygalactose transaminase